MTTDKPAEAPDVAVSEPEPDRWQPVEQPDVAEHDNGLTQPAQPSGEDKQEAGTPAGQLAVGAASVLTLGGFGLYQALGALGLLAGAGGTVACAGGYGYWRWRQTHPRRDRSRRDRGVRSTHHSPAGGWSGRKMTFGSPSGRSTRTSTSSRMPPLGNRSGRAGRHLFTGGQPPSGRTPGAFRPNPKQPASGPRGADRSRHQAPGAARSAAQQLATAGRTIRRRTTSPRLDAHTAHLAHQAGRYARTARQHLTRAGQAIRRRAATPHLDQRAADAARRAGRWVDRRTGQRASTAWAAALTGGRRAAVAALRQRYRRWDAEVVAALVSGWAWLTRRWRTSPSPPDATPQPAPDTTLTLNQTHPQPATPASPPAPLVPGRTTPVSSFTLLQAAIELPGAAAAYHSDDMMDVDAHLASLDEVTGAVATGFRIWADRLRAEYPLHDDVVERLEEMYSSFAKIGAQGQEVSEVFKVRHKDDIARRVTPRVGERKWNVQ
ncbi:hypothetical protein [Streptosporangium sp. NPDC049078]|uniref:hypothetical protein n=1 Tax=Streptosporangium sp. NPDC049078 TaxID=3155767 RepID=UPI003428303E